jgi:hypothetical protein
LALVVEQTAAIAQRTVSIVIDSSYEPFVAKLQKAKTRKDKDYFVLRVSIPKNAAQKLEVGPGDYVFFRAKKAEWFHMLDWDQMKGTWNMLPEEIKQEVYLSGLIQPPTAGPGILSGTGGLPSVQPGAATPTLTVQPEIGASNVQVRGGV